MQNTVYDNRLSGKQDTGRAEARPPNPQPKTHKPRTYTRGASPPEPPRRMGGIQGGQAPLSPVGPGTGDGPLRWKMNPPSPGDREPGTRNREPGTGDREPGTGDQGRSALEASCNFAAPTIPQSNIWTNKDNR